MEWNAYLEQKKRDMSQCLLLFKVKLEQVHPATHQKHVNKINKQTMKKQSTNIQSKMDVNQVFMCSHLKAARINAAIQT